MKSPNNPKYTILIAGLHKIGQAPPGMARFIHFEISQPAPAPRSPPRASVMTARNFLPSIRRRGWNRRCRGQKQHIRSCPSPWKHLPPKISGSDRCFRSDHRSLLHPPMTSTGETLQFQYCNDCSDIHRSAYRLRSDQIQFVCTC